MLLLALLIFFVCNRRRFLSDYRLTLLAFGGSVAAGLAGACWPATRSAWAAPDMGAGRCDAMLGATLAPLSSWRSIWSTWLEPACIGGADLLTCCR